MNVALHLQAIRAERSYTRVSTALVVSCCAPCCRSASTHRQPVSECRNSKTVGRTCFVGIIGILRHAAIPAALSLKLAVIVIVGLPHQLAADFDDS